MPYSEKKQNLSNQILKKASAFAKRKMFRKNQSVVMIENGQLILMDKHHNKTFLKDLPQGKSH